jgi:2-keto-4-pentenoate hydratase/2-oxohepta-3-ene-1,7-dioic acid hydratase in catechol pathway
VRLAFFYTTEAEREADLLRRIPRAARLGIVTPGEDDISGMSGTLQPVRFQDTSTGFDLPDILEAAAADGLDKLLSPTGNAVPLQDVYLGPPVLRPRAFLDFYTFEQHVRTARSKRGLDVIPEWYDYPVYYNSNTSALFGHGQRVPFPSDENRCDYELELACIIGRESRNVAEADAQQCIAGYCLLNDWSARRWQARVMKVGLGPARGKDHGSTLGPWLTTHDEVPDPRSLAMRAYVNGEQWSAGSSGSSHFTFAQMIAFASRTRTLYPGDVLGSGTVGTGCGLELDRFIKPGDTVRLEIDGLGCIENEIYAEAT